MVRFLVRGFWTFFAAVAIAAGLLLAFPSAWGSYWFAPWLAMGAWLLVLRRADKKYALAISGLAAFLFFLLLFRWVSTSLGFNTPWIALSLCESLFLMTWASLTLALRHLSNPLWSLWAAFSYAGLEAWRASFPWTGMPWGLLGFSQVDSPLKGWIPLLGESGMAFLMVFILAALVSVTWKVTMPNLVAAGLSLAVIIASGMGIPALGGSRDTGQIRVAAMQGGVSWPIEQVYAHPGTILNGHIRQARQVKVQPSEVILWGEQAADVDLGKDSAWADDLHLVQQSLKAPIVFGMLSYSEKTTSNQVLQVNNGEIKPVYTKRKPVPFGEFLPGRTLVSKIFPEQVKMLPRDMVAGKEVGIAKVGKARLGTNICFEVALDSLVRQTVNSGANVLFFPTNNSSFGYSYQSRQQLQIARFRALEYNRSGAQVAIGGVSALINPEGKVLAQSGLFRSDTLQADLPLRDTLTFQARFGALQNALVRWGFLGAALVLIFGFGMRLWRERYQSVSANNRARDTKESGKGRRGRWQKKSKGKGKK